MQELQEVTIEGYVDHIVGTGEYADMMARLEG